MHHLCWAPSRHTHQHPAYCLSYLLLTYLLTNQRHGQDYSELFNGSSVSGENADARPAWWHRPANPELRRIASVRPVWVTSQQKIPRIPLPGIQTLQARVPPNSLKTISSFLPDVSMPQTKARPVPQMPQLPLSFHPSLYPHYFNLPASNSQSSMSWDSAISSGSLTQHP